MRISEKMGLKKSKLELDFFDYEFNKDNYAFLDPYYISKKEDDFLMECNEYIETFFNRFLFLLKTDEDKAYDIFSHLGEVNEICLGMSEGSPSGNGIGKIDTKKIFKAIKESDAFQNESAKRIEDVRLFIEGIDKDKISDMVANIIKYPLIKYTQDQCKLLNVPLIAIEAGYWWDKDKWVRGHQEMLVLDDKPYLLYPKNLVTDAKRYSAMEYFKIYILQYLQEKHIAENSELVRKTYNRDGTVKRIYVYKKDIEKDFEKKGVEITKDWIARFTKENPEVFRKFKQSTITKISGMVTDEVTPTEIEEIIETLKNELIKIPVGSKDATKYHHLISGILELLFYPYVAHPRIEDEIHDGRKRIDITFSNIAEKGFFYLLGTSYNIPCQLIMVECKNYSKDIANPELDQIAGRFSAKRGKFGIICCRSVDHEDLFVEREKDTFKDDRGCIIHLTDKDIIELLDQRKNNITVDSFMTKKYNEIIK